MFWIRDNGMLQVFQCVRPGHQQVQRQAQRQGQSKLHTPLPALILAVFAVFLAGCSAPETADLVLMGGKVHTLDPSHATVEAVAIRDGRILTVGSETDVSRHIGEGSKVVDLHGLYVYPGFTDSHAHLLGIGERELTLNLEGTQGVGELKATVSREVAEREPGEWILGRGWIETHWTPAEFPTRFNLDEVSPDNPVVLWRADGHALVANSKAFGLAGIDAETEAPFGGAILKNSAGEPTGMLVDNAMKLLADVMPERAIPMQRAYVIGAERSARFGWTQIQDAGATFEQSEIIRQLAEAGKLDVRVYSAIEGPGDSTDILLERGKTASADQMFVRRGIKVSVDGALGSRGAALLEPYADADTTGLLTWTKEQLLPLYRDALRKGIQIETHAIGDHANRFVLDLYEQVFEEIPPVERAIEDPRWRIEHAQILHPDDLPRFAELGVIPSMQASHAIGDLHFAPRRLGMERLSGAYAWRDLIDSGVIIPGGSDAPVESGDPRIEFYASITRKDLKGFQAEGWHPEQAMTREEALKSLTLWPAIAAFQENDRGTIAAGKLADFTVLDVDLMQAPAEEIPSASIMLTVVNGRIVHDAREQ